MTVLTRIVLAFSCAIALAGCANFMKKVAGIEDVDMTAPEKLDEPASGNPNDADVSQSVKQLRGVWQDENKIEQAATFLNLRYESRRTYFEALNTADSAHEAAKQRYAKAYFDSGIALSDMLCSEWFNRVALARIAADQTSDWLSSTATAASAILGFTGTSPEVMGIVGSSLGFGRDITQDTINNYLLEADLGELEKALTIHRQAGADFARANGSDSDYFLATTALVRYHDSCTPRSVKSFMTSALRAAKPETSTIDTGVFVSAVADAIQTYFDTKLKPTDVVDLFLYFTVNGTEEKDLKEALKKALKERKLLTEPDDTLAVKNKNDEVAVKNYLKLSDSAGSLTAASAERRTKLKGADKPTTPPPGKIQKRQAPGQAAEPG